MDGTQLATVHIYLPVFCSCYGPLQHRVLFPHSSGADYTAPDNGDCLNPLVSHDQSFCQDGICSNSDINTCPHALNNDRHLNCCA